MNKRIRKLLSGVLAVMFVGQVMIYGDGSSQGIVHAETIAGIRKCADVLPLPAAMKKR